MRINIIFGLIIFRFSLFGQFSDNFDDGNLSSNPSWNGNTTNFIVDTDKKLRLNAPDQGSSWLYLETIYPDSFELGFKLKMEFSPSASNASRVYFLTDNSDYLQTNGYFLLLGENGSGDRIKIYKIENGGETLIAQGLDGALAKDPSVCNVKMTFRNNKDFVLLADYDDNGSFDDNISWVDNTPPTLSKYFGFYAVYTATRVDKFAYDDVYLKPFELDKTNPSLVDLQVISNKELILVFDENLEATSASQINNYSVDNGIGNPSSTVFDPLVPNQVKLLFNNEFTSTDELTLTIENVADLSGNTISSINTTFLYAKSPEINEIVLSEILFNPYIDSEDFVELYNASDNYILLTNMVIGNLDNGQNLVVNSDFILAPKSYVALTEDVESVKTIYNTPADANIVNAELPSYNNDDGIVALFNLNNEMLDSFFYNEDQHFKLLDDVEGVSLEKINLAPFDNSVSNWHSASSFAGYATPGYKNSNSISNIDINEEFVFEKKTFSPDGDSKDDLLILIYNLPESGYVATINVYSAEGYLVKNLTKNELLGREGVITWDGTNNDGYIEKLGIYILKGEVFEPAGGKLGLKKDCVLATFID